MWVWLLSLFGARAEVPPEQRVAQIEKMYASYRKAGFAKVPDVTPDGVRALEDPVFVDVRPESERSVSMIPGAISKEAFEADPEVYRDRVIVPYCTIGARSGLYAKKLMKRGFDVRNLKGSILLWTHAGQPLEAEGKPTTRVHTYGKRWALVAEGYQATW